MSRFKVAARGCPVPRTGQRGRKAAGLRMKRRQFAKSFFIRTPFKCDTTSNVIGNHLWKNLFLLLLVIFKICGRIRMTQKCALFLFCLSFTRKKLNQARCWFLPWMCGKRHYVARLDLDVTVRSAEGSVLVRNRLPGKLSEILD